MGLGGLCWSFCPAVTACSFRLHSPDTATDLCLVKQGRIPKRRGWWCPQDILGDGEQWSEPLGHRRCINDTTNTIKQHPQHFGAHRGDRQDTATAAPQGPSRQGHEPPRYTHPSSRCSSVGVRNRCPPPQLPMATARVTKSRRGARTRGWGAWESLCSISKDLGSC